MEQKVPNNNVILGLKYLHEIKLITVPKENPKSIISSWVYPISKRYFNIYFISVLIYFTNV